MGPTTFGREGNLTRPKRLGLACALAIVLSVLQITGLGIPMVQQAQAATPVTLRYGFLEAVDSLNPFRGLNDPAFELYGLIYDYLFSFDQDGNYVPNIAVAAHCDAVCMNWTYQIRQGVHWNDPQNPSNNGELTAKDVAFTINYNIQNFFQLWNYEPYVNRIVQCPKGQTTNCGAVITSPWNVTVYFDRPFVPGRALFVPILNQTQWQGISATSAQSNYNNPDPIGTGPFIADPNIYTEFQNGQPLHLTVNPNYHGGAPHLTDIYFQQYSDENSLVAALEANPPAVDLAKFTPYGYNAVAGKANIGQQEGLLVTQYWNEIGITQIDSTTTKGLNPERFDINVRRALAMATNKDHILQSIYLNKGVRGDTIMSPITPQWWLDPTTVPGLNLTFDLQAANALLNQSGYTGWTGGVFGSGIRFNPNPINVFVQTNAFPNGTTKTIPAGTQLTFTMAVRQEFVQEQDTANYLKAEWAQIGVNIVPKVELESALSNDVYKGNVEMYIWYWSGDPDPNYLLSIESGFTLDGWNDNYFDNSTYNQDYVNQLSATNSTQRQTIVRAAEQVHYTNAVYIIYIYPYGEWAYRTDTLAGWGDWNAHPYRQVNAFWGANPLFLELHAAVPNHCPTTPVIQGTPPISAFTGENVTFVGNSTDVDAGQTLNWTWAWGDQTTNVSQTTTAVSAQTAVHAWSQVGTYSVALTVSDGYCSVTSSPFQVDVLGAGAHGWINGTVTDAATGQPVHGAAVKTTPGNWGSTSDPNGAYSIVAPPGTYTVSATAALYLSKSSTGVVVALNQTTTANFALTANVGWVAGKVTSTANGATISGAAIYVYSGTGAIVAAKSTDSNGAYNVTVTPGTYAVNVSATGYDAVNKTVSVTLGQTTSLDVSLAPSTVPSGGLSTLELAAIGAVIVVVAAAVAFVLLTRKRKKQESEDKLDLTKNQGK